MSGPHDGGVSGPYFQMHRSGEEFQDATPTTKPLLPDICRASLPCSSGCYEWITISLRFFAWFERRTGLQFKLSDGHGICVQIRKSHAITKKCILSLLENA